MNPAQFAARYRTLLQRLCVLRNLELAGAIGDDHRTVQESLLRNRAPHALK
jgi:hypothetical protein